MQTQDFSAPAPLVPQLIHESPLMRSGGFAVFGDLLDPTSVQRLLSEALTLYPTAGDNYVSVSDGYEGRGGSPARRFFSAPGGTTQDAFYHAPWLLAFLRDLTSSTVERSSGRGTYSYYTRPGDHLALHRDVESCDLTLITALHDTLDGRAADGALCLYPDRVREPLAAIRRTPDQGAVKLRLLPGQTVALYGGIVPHTLLPVAVEQRRIVSILCFRVVVPG